MTHAYRYRCPTCGTPLEFRKRVTVVERRCPHCGTSITPSELDKQEGARAETARRGCLIVLVSAALMLVTCCGGPLLMGVVGSAFVPTGFPTTSRRTPAPEYKTQQVESVPALVGPEAGGAAPAPAPGDRPARGGPVNVRGYTRKDGTYVRPHTRALPGQGAGRSAGRRR
jgi:hypothetical protein